MSGHHAQAGPQLFGSSEPWQSGGRQDHGETWSGHSGGAIAHGRPQASWGNDGSSIDVGNLYATGHNYHLGSLQRPTPFPLSSAPHPAGALEMPSDMMNWGLDMAERRRHSSFAVEGHNPMLGPIPPPMPFPLMAGEPPSGQMVSPFGLAASASAGALLAPGLSPGNRGLSAMSIDARGRDRSPSSRSPPPARRQLIESASAPKLGDALPPLMIQQRFHDEAMRTSPASTFGPSRPRAGALQKIPGRVLVVKDEEATWRQSQTKHFDDILLGKAAGPNSGGGIAGWTLSGHSPEGVSS